MNTYNTPIRPLVRCLFAAAALVATLACGAFIDGLAVDYSTATMEAKAGTQRVASYAPPRKGTRNATEKERGTAR